MRSTSLPASRIVTTMLALSLSTTACSDSAGPSDPTFFDDRIAFSYVVEGSGTVLATVNPDGSDIRKVPLPASFKSSTIGDIAWTRDHRWLAFAAKPAGTDTHYDLFIISPIGLIPTNITQTPDLDEVSPTWSPDATQIAFERNGIISIINTDGSGEHVLVGPNPNNSGSYDPDWSPDGTTIVYRGYGEQLWTVNTTSSAEPVSIRGMAFMRGQPTWKPDGSRILFWEVGPTGPGGGEIISIAPNGSDPQTISPALVGYSPVWSPDGNRVAVVGTEEPNVGFSILTPATSDIVTFELPGDLGRFAWK